jgi:hypothetical protein
MRGVPFYAITLIEVAHFNFCYVVFMQLCEPAALRAGNCTGTCQPSPKLAPIRQLLTATLESQLHALRLGHCGTAEHRGLAAVPMRVLRRITLAIDRRWSLCA